ncbi:MAG: PqqD family protein [Spirochaetaceae bacterium]|jgi:hypothetical protein|nr:PqqD family protein [Spirochaetaceae bacterium]
MNSVFSHLASHIPLRKELKLRIEGNIGIVCSAHDFRVHYLNETALMIFNLIDGKRSIAEIARRFLEMVDVERAVFEPDLIEAIRNFQWQKLIVLKTNP